MLLVPVAAGAKDARIGGPAVLVGGGFYGGELTMSTADDQRPVRIAGGGGYVGILDLGGDLKVRCTGKSRVQQKETEQGTVFLCGPRTGEAVILGSHFRFRGHAAHYRAQIPRGAAGSFHGRFKRAGEQLPRSERPASGQPEEDDEEIPTLAELAAMLEGK